MHAVIATLAPILAAEKSKTPFYIAGGLLVAWAFVLSLALGMRNPSFPRSGGVQRVVMVVSAVLVVAAVSMAVATSGGSTSKATIAPASPAATPTAPAAAPTTPAAKEGQEAAPGASASSLKEEANPEGQLKFTSANLSAKAGKVTISFANASPLEHNMTIAQGTQVLGATPTFKGGSKTLTLNLKPGTYKFFCTVPGHREAGMEGTLTVS